MTAIARGAMRVVVATAAFGLLHSVLADTRSKAAFERAVGTRRRNAWYRPLYNAHSVVSLAALAAYVLRQPSRTLYHVRGPAAVAMRAGQAASVVYIASAAVRTGPFSFAGLPGLVAWVLRRPNVPREPAGQGPALNEQGRVHDCGPFAHSRQPANVGMVPLLLLNPRVTTRSAAVCLTLAAYSLLGAVHSDRMIGRQYGQAFDDYRRRVPLLFGRHRGG
ncbi:MAG TPA: hypothetical protein VF595_03815 [Tepidisphaeraceae bacterium]